MFVRANGNAYSGNNVGWLLETSASARTLESTVSENSFLFLPVRHSKKRPSRTAEECSIFSYKPGPRQEFILIHTVYIYTALFCM